MANIMRLGGGGASGTISITTNGVYDVKKYATANVNVQSAPVLLWTNASPTSAFAAQTVNVSSGYDGYLIEMAFTNYDETVRAITFVKNGGSTTVSAPEKQPAAYAMNGTFRGVSCNNGSVIFTVGYYYRAENYNNVWGIPTRIWGVKFTL